MIKILLIANFISFAGCILMVTVGLLKSKTNILLVQALQCLMFGIATFMLGGYSGAASDGISILRNLYCIKFEFGYKSKLTFIGLQIIAAMIFNNLGLVGWIPCLAAVIFTISLSTSNVIVLKFTDIVVQSIWSIFDLKVQNYSGVAFDIITVVSNCIGIVRVIKDRQIHEESEVIKS